jgi:hypothetical protein
MRPAHQKEHSMGPPPKSDSTPHTPDTTPTPPKPGLLHFADDADAAAKKLGAAYDAAAETSSVFGDLFKPPAPRLTPEEALEHARVAASRADGS